jgi:hypothetical protein
MTKDTFNKDRQELERAISYGVSEDNINLKTVSFWIVLGILMVTIILYGVYNMYSYNQFLSSQEAAINAEFHELNRMRERDHRMLNTFEVVDEENQRYRIPIDSAMALIARE